MNDPHDRLIQRFIDQELTAEERLAFVVSLGRDEALRDRVMALERLTLESRRLPRPVVPESFAADVMARLDPAPSRWRRWVDELLAPRTVRWNIASAAAVACVVIVAASFSIARRSPTSSVAAVQAPAAATPVLVRLVVLQPQARTVEVAGDFNGWNPARTPLEETASGAWTVTLPLQPGRYKYMFVIDGREWIVDPFAAEQSDDGFGSRNAVLDVRPPSPRVSS